MWPSHQFGGSEISLKLSNAGDSIAERINSGDKGGSKLLAEIFNNWFLTADILYNEIKLRKQIYNIIKNVDNQKLKVDQAVEKIMKLLNDK